MVRLGRRRLGWMALLLLAAAVGGSVAVFAWPDPDPDALWRLARAEFEARRFDRVEATLARLARLREPTPLDWMLRAQLALARERNDEALAALGHVPDDHAMAPQAWLQRGQIELRRDRLRTAEAAFLRALELDPKLVQARKELVFIYGMQLRRPELGAQFRALSELIGLNQGEIFTWCLTRGIVWEPDEASADLARFLRADPDDRWSRLALVETYRQLNRLDDAEAAVKPLPVSDPDARAARAWLALDRGDVEAAEVLLAEGPADHAELARLRGRLAFARRDGEAALHHMRLAHAASPDDRDILSLLGQTLRTLGRDDEAKPYLETVRKQDLLAGLLQNASPTDKPKGVAQDPKLFHRLGDACEALGRLPEARSWYRLAIARDPLDQEAQRALFRINAAAATTEPPTTPRPAAEGRPVHPEPRRGG